jgi:DNA replication protein DnaC
MNDYRPIRITTCPEPRACPGLVKLDVPSDHPQYGQTLPCLCERRKQAARLLAQWPLAWRNMTFERFQASTSNERTLERVRRFAADPWASRPLLTLIGPSQVGKTHLALAIINALLVSGEPAHFCSVPDLLDELLRGYADDTYLQRLRMLQQTPILALDDLGAEQTQTGGAYAVTWAQDKLYQIIAERVQQQRPTVITTNLIRTQLPARLAERMWNPRHGVVVAVVAANKV